MQALPSQLVHTTSSEIQPRLSTSVHGLHTALALSQSKSIKDFRAYRRHKGLSDGGTNMWRTLAFLSLRLHLLFLVIEISQSRQDTPIHMQE